MIEPSVGHCRRRVRVEQAENDQIVLAAGGSEERASVVWHDGDARRVVRTLGMMAAAHVNDGRIDLHCGHVLGGAAQRTGGVVARAGPYDQHLLRTRFQAQRQVVLAKPRRFVIRLGAQVEQRLIAGVVHTDELTRPTALSSIDVLQNQLLIGRPAGFEGRRVVTDECAGRQQDGHQPQVHDPIFRNPNERQDQSAGDEQGSTFVVRLPLRGVAKAASQHAAG